jgi:3,4-dihydroxy 2-butanone 4-phosphate synthase/GTP cyclohydrolase II
MDKVILDKAEANLPTEFGEFKVVAFKTRDGLSHAALVYGEVNGRNDVLVRIHSECLTGDVMHSLKCDCGNQFNTAQRMIKENGSGVIVYLRQEGRGIGLFNKIKAYALQDKGEDTVDANIKLEFKADQRDYTIGAAILKELGLSSIKLITNNPRKIEGLEKYGIKITGRVPLVIKTNKHNEFYLETKKERLGHIFEDKGVIN